MRCRFADVAKPEAAKNTTVMARQPSPYAVHVHMFNGEEVERGQRSRDIANGAGTRERRRCAQICRGCAKEVIRAGVNIGGAVSRC